MTRYWMAAISREHTERGVDGNFIQVCHGKQAPLKRMKKGDYIIVYSGKISMANKEKYQKFTAIGQVMSDTVYQFEMTPDFKPYRRDINFHSCEEISIIPLINQLEFIQNKKAWGYPFRFGFFEINKHDFDIIAAEMMRK